MHRWHQQREKRAWDSTSEKIHLWDSSSKDFGNTRSAPIKRYVSERRKGEQTSGTSGSSCGCLLRYQLTFEPSPHGTKTESSRENRHYLLVLCDNILGHRQPVPDTQAPYGPVHPSRVSARRTEPTVRHKIWRKTCTQHTKTSLSKYSVIKASPNVSVKENI